MWTAVAAMYAANNSFQAVHGARGTSTHYHRIPEVIGADDAPPSDMTAIKNLLIIGVLGAAATASAQTPRLIVLGDRDASGPTRQHVEVTQQAGPFTLLSIAAVHGNPVIDHVTIRYSGDGAGTQRIDFKSREIKAGECAGARDPEQHCNPFIGGSAGRLDIPLDKGARYIEDVVIDFGPSSSGEVAIAAE